MTSTLPQGNASRVASSGPDARHSTSPPTTNPPVHAALTPDFPPHPHPENSTTPISRISRTHGPSPPIPSFSVSAGNAAFSAPGVTNQSDNNPNLQKTSLSLSVLFP